MPCMAVIGVVRGKFMTPVHRKLPWLTFGDNTSYCQCIIGNCNVLAALPLKCVFDILEWSDKVHTRKYAYNGITP